MAWEGFGEYVKLQALSLVTPGNGDTIRKMKMDVVNDAVWASPEMQNAVKAADERGAEALEEANAAGKGNTESAKRLSAVINSNEHQLASGSSETKQDRLVSQCVAGGAAGLFGVAVGGKLFGKWGALAGGVLFTAVGAYMGKELGVDLVSAWKYGTQERFADDNIFQKGMRIVKAAGSNLFSKGQVYASDTILDNMQSSELASVIGDSTASVETTATTNTEAVSSSTNAESASASSEQTLSADSSTENSSSSKNSGAAKFDSKPDIVTVENDEQAIQADPDIIPD